MQLSHQDPSIKWDGSLYQCGCRSKHGSSSQLIVYMEPLKILLSMAPSGFPSFLDLRQSIILLDNLANVLQATQDNDKFQYLPIPRRRSSYCLDLHAEETPPWDNWLVVPRCWEYAVWMIIIYNTKTLVLLIRHFLVR